MVGDPVSAISSAQRGSIIAVLDIAYLRASACMTS